MSSSRSIVAQNSTSVIVLVESPQMVAMLEDAGLDSVLEIDATKLMIAGKSRNHFEAKFFSRARSLDDRDARIQRLVEMSASADGGANLVQRGRIVIEAVTVRHHREKILGASQSRQGPAVSEPGRSAFPARSATVRILRFAVIAARNLGP